MRNELSQCYPHVGLLPESFAESVRMKETTNQVTVGHQCTTDIPNCLPLVVGWSIIKSSRRAEGVVDGLPGIKHT